MHNIYVIGDANVDIIVPYPRFLNEERTLIDYPNPQLAGGGTSANTAVALAKLGLPVSFLGTIGEDQYGKYIQKDFEEQGVEYVNFNTQYFKAFTHELKAYTDYDGHMNGDAARAYSKVLAQVLESK